MRLLTLRSLFVLLRQDQFHHQPFPDNIADRVLAMDDPAAVCFRTRHRAGDSLLPPVVAQGAAMQNDLLAVKLFLPLTE